MFKFKFIFYNRWVHVLDHKRRDGPWTWEEHMRLFYGIRLFGRDECAKIAKFLPGRNNMDVRMRIRFLVKWQIEVLFSFILTIKHS
jgi:hypothetical protein